MNLEVPCRHNETLEQLLKLINADPELDQWLKSANINAIDRSGLNDHGEVHIRIVANAALRMLRLLIEKEVEPNAVKEHSLTRGDAEVVVVLAACLHDVGIAIHRLEHERHSLILAYPKARQLLQSLYSEPQLTAMVGEVLHAIAAHRWDVPCLTLEAGVLKVADALDMSQGRSRIPFEAGQVNIHSLSAQAVQQVSIGKGENRPVRIEIHLSNSAGIFQVDELLQRKIKNSTLLPHIEILSYLQGDLLKVYRF